MKYRSMRECVEDLDRTGQLVRISREVDPNLEMAEIQRRVYQANGPAILYEKVKGSPFMAVSNLYGSMERSRFIFRHSLERLKKLMELKADPTAFLRAPLNYLTAPLPALHALPLPAVSAPVMERQTTIDRLPQIKCWPDDGGAYILLPQVYSEDPLRPGVMHSNIGMYRVQLGGNDYEPNREIGLHYQIRRDIGIHHQHALETGGPLQVSIFVGGPPSHAFSAVMPLPEEIPEAVFAGMLAGRNFRYRRSGGHLISADADFCITGTIQGTKPEGPFGDHIGYYSLRHDFPLLKVEHVYHRRDAIWPFTVVGRPPQEDTAFGNLIHEITGPLVPSSMPGVDSVHAVDAAGVHPLLLARARESYVPYEESRPMEILTIANAILGFNHCALAKYLMIAANDNCPDTQDVAAFMRYVLERIDFRRDLHFQTQTTIDTLDYSGEGLNRGSKLVMAAAGPRLRELAREMPSDMKLPSVFKNPKLCLPGILALECRGFEQADLDQIKCPDGIALIILTEESEFAARNLNNLLWVTFTRSNPSHDVHGVRSFIRHKHWGCEGPLVIDARLKPHHAPPLIEDPRVTARVDELGRAGGPLHGII